MLNKLRNWINEVRLEAHDSSLLKKIKKYGWTATYVYGEDDEDHQDFAYTRGFSDFGAPELIVFNLDPQLVNGLFWQYFEYQRSGRELVDGLVFRIPEMDGFECTLRKAVQPQTWEQHVFDAICYSRMHGRSDRPDVMQIVWPSAATGQYPWSPGCPETVITSQPALYQGSPPSGAPVVDLPV